MESTPSPSPRRSPSRSRSAASTSADRARCSRPTRSSASTATPARSRCTTGWTTTPATSGRPCSRRGSRSTATAACPRPGLTFRLQQHLSPPRSPGEQDMTPTTTGTDPTTLKAAYASFPTGVAAVCAQSGGELIGMAASSFTAVSLDPPLVSVCVMNTSRTWQRLRGSARLGVSILAADQGAVCAAIGRRRVDRFAGIDTAVSPEDAVFVRGAGVWLDCEVQSLLPAGDHTIVLLGWSDSTSMRIASRSCTSQAMSANSCPGCRSRATEPHRSEPAVPRSRRESCHDRSARDRGGRAG